MTLKHEISRSIRGKFYSNWAMTCEVSLSGRLGPFGAMRSINSENIQTDVKLFLENGRYIWLGIAFFSPLHSGLGLDSHMMDGLSFIDSPIDSRWCWGAGGFMEFIWSENILSKNFLTNLWKERVVWEWEYFFRKFHCPPESQLVCPIY